MILSTADGSFTKAWYYDLDSYIYSLGFDPIFDNKGRIFFRLSLSDGKFMIIRVCSPGATDCNSPWYFQSKESGIPLGLNIDDD